MLLEYKIFLGKIKRTLIILLNYWSNYCAALYDIMATDTESVGVTLSLHRAFDWMSFAFIGIYMFNVYNLLLSVWEWNKFGE